MKLCPRYFLLTWFTTTILGIRNRIFPYISLDIRYYLKKFTMAKVFSPNTFIQDFSQPCRLSLVIMCKKSNPKCSLFSTTFERDENISLQPNIQIQTTKLRKNGLRSMPSIKLQTWLRRHKQKNWFEEATF